MRYVASILVPALLAACGGDSVSFIECEQVSDCNLEPGGDCLGAPSGRDWCAYPDLACGSGYRWSDLDVGDGLAGACVEAASDAGGLPDASVDAAVGVDAAVDAMPEEDGGGHDAAPDVDGGRCGGPADCPAAEQPVCDLGSGFCRGCAAAGGDGECAAIDPAHGRCAPDGTCAACLGSLDCATGPPICDGESRECRGCLSGPPGDAECVERSPSMPRCVDQACVECSSDADCGSEVCDEAAASCVPEDEIIYVAKTGNDLPGCGARMAPCFTIGTALARITGPQRIVRVRPGVYAGSLLVDGQAVTFVGDGATVTPAAVSNTPVLRIVNLSEVTIEAMTITTGIGGTSAHGVRCESGSTLTMVSAEVSANSGQGVSVEDCALTVERSRIASNQRGGIAITNAPFRLVNNFIVANGTGGAGGSTFGGLRILNDFSAMQVLDFNTIGGNNAQPTAVASGVQCVTATALTARNNIVYLGVGGLAAVNPGSCAWTHSDIEAAEVVAGEGNLNVDPRFRDPAAGAVDYHLLDDSPCLDVAEDIGVGNDFDGDPRPHGDGPDMGADEQSP